jgi:hypothetical protein
VRLVVVSSLVVVLGLASWIGVAFSDCSGPTNGSLVWIHPGGVPFPATERGVICSWSGANTPKLGLSASRLGPGEGCQFVASLHNTGRTDLRIFESTRESTPRGDPSFTTCFGFTLSAGPPHEGIEEGGSYPYTITIELLSSASSLCANAAGSVSLTFTGTPP